LIFVLYDFYRCQSPTYIGSRCQSPTDIGSRCQSPTDIGNRCQSPTDIGNRCQSPTDIGSRWYISNLQPTARFWNSLHEVRTELKDWKAI
jgi:hypothetical protein